MTTIDLQSNIYLHLVSNTIQYSTDINFTPTDINTWPVTFTNSTVSNKTVFITTNLTLTGGTHRYFIMGSDNITIDGQNNIVEINGASGYPGLVQNGASSTNGKNNIIIKNLGVTAINSTLADYVGWVGQQYMNMNATGCQATNCYSTGAISGDAAGGIFGYLSSGTATNCYSAGNITGLLAGGIFGSYSGGTAINCYSSGAFSGSSDRGIFGQQSSGTATNCYSANGSWNDTAAGETNRLLGGPTYFGSILTSQGSIWFDVDPVNSNVPFRLKSFNPTIIQPPFTAFSLLPLSINEKEIYSGTITSDSTTEPQYTILSQPIDNLYISGNTVSAKYPFNYREYKNYPVQISGTARSIVLYIGNDVINELARDRNRLKLYLFYYFHINNKVDIVL
jgi:hypothetical protein